MLSYSIGFSTSTLIDLNIRGSQKRSTNIYLKLISAFLETLCLLIHITGGQPARAFELLSIRYFNTIQGGHRNIFVEGGPRVNTQIIHIFLPKAVSKMVIWYLWLIVPFKEYLESDLTKQPATMSRCSGQRAKRLGEARRNGMFNELLVC